MVDEIDYDPYEYWDEEDPDDSDEWVLDCGDPDCCMNFTYHYRSECYTPEMYEAMVAEGSSETAGEPR